MHRFFVTGTDTGVGKTEIAAALLSLMAARDERPFAFKPCESGGTGDTDALREAGGGWQSASSVCVYRLKAPLAPALAAKLEGRRIDFKKLVRAFHSLGPGPGVVEGAGGLFVPLTAHHDVIDLAVALALPVVLVARAGLGTINHCTLSLDALRARGLDVAAVVLTQASPGKDPSIRFNRRELERRFPSSPVLGPLRWEPNESRRRIACQRQLTSLL